MANIFKVLRDSINVLKLEKRFCKNTNELELNQEKVIALEEIFHFAKENILAYRQGAGDVEERLHYYLHEGGLNYQKVAERFKVSFETVAGNVHYASKSFFTLVGDQINRIKDAGDIETVRVAVSEFREIRKSVVNPYNLPEISEELLKSLHSKSKKKKLKVGGVVSAKNTPSIIIP